jgi:hypothetical protein
MTFGDELNQQYKGYTICGRAQAVHIGRGRYCAHASVLLTRPKVCVEVYRDYDRFLNFDNEDEAQIVGLFLAELAHRSFCTVAGVLSNTDEHRLGRRHPSARRGRVHNARDPPA